MYYFKQNYRSNFQNSKHTFIVVTAAVLSGLVVLTVLHFSKSDTHKVILQAKQPNTVAPHPHSLRSSPSSHVHSPVLLQRNPPEPIVTSAQGQVQGKQLESRAGRIYYAFYDIPYAKPPVGSLRFKPPEPADPWEGIRDGTKIGLECIQKEKYAPVLRAAGREDCLYLNVYTPKVVTNGENPQLPVMVYIHGGEFQTGNGSRYGADYFMDEDVVIVTIEYRLGALGFLTTDDQEIPANLALKDCIMALRWVQKYIEAYGGDPTKVTIFGNSSGGSMVHAVMLSHMSKGLFHRAICESGTALLAGGALPFGKPFAIDFAQKLGCSNTNSSKEVAECLRGLDAATIQTTDFLAAFFIIENIPEGGSEADVIFSRRPIDIVEDTENFPNKVPWIVGDNSAEELSFALQTLKDPELVEALNTDWAGNIVPQMRFRTPPTAEKLEKIRDFYFPFNMKLSNTTRYTFIDMLSDGKWVHATKTAAVAHAKHSPVYLYWITKEPAKSYASKNLAGFDPPYGVNHADELQYLFLYDGYPEIPIGSQYTRFSQLLVSNWVHFANTTYPSQTDWQPIDPEDNGARWYELGDKCREIRRLRRRMKFWDDYKQEMYY